MISCPSCPNKATMHPTYGPTLCTTCLSKQEPWNDNSHEWTTDEIKEGRKEYRDELRQAWRQGEISKEYLDANPDHKQGMIKDGIITKDQADNAKEVWGNDDL